MIPIGLVDVRVVEELADPVVLTPADLTELAEAVWPAARTAAREGGKASPRIHRWSQGKNRGHFRGHHAKFPKYMEIIINTTPPKNIPLSGSEHTSRHQLTPADTSRHQQTPADTS